MPESNRHDDEDPLEKTELVRRLRRMEWPPAPSEVKERVLQRIVSDRASDSDENGGSGAAEPPATR
jgi:hypothetical protein